jgi:small subunit ribosomal protein S20
LATHKSAEKRARQNKKRQLRNVSVKSRVKTRLKAVLSVVGEKKKDDSREALAKAIAVIDKAASKGVLHKNTASRKISRLTRKVNQLD